MSPISTPSTCTCNMPIVMPLYFRIFRFSRVAILHTCIYLVTTIFRFLPLHYFLTIFRVEMDVQRRQAVWLEGKRCDPSSWISTGTFSPFVVYSLNFFYIFPIYEINILWPCYLSYEWNLVGLNLHRFLRVGYCIYHLRILGLKIKCWWCGLCCRKMWRFSYLFKMVD